MESETSAIFKDDFISRFTDIYFEESLRIAAKKVSLDEFDRTVREKVSQRLHIPLELVLHLHHPFHWTFFNDVGIESMFYFGQPFYNGEKLSVDLKREYSPSEINAQKEHIIRSYGEYLQARIKSFGED